MQKRSLCSNFLPIISILLILPAVTTISIPFAKAQMLELSNIQNNIFFLSHQDALITPATFKTDRYIDDEQAEFFYELSTVKPYVPADKDYAFTLIDHYTLDSDLVIEYKYDNILCSVYPQKMFLSRHNISIADYTDTKVPPTYLFNTRKGVDPYTGEKVTGFHLEVNNYEYEQDEYIHNYAFTECDVDGYRINTYIRVYSTQASLWIRLTDTELMKRCNPPLQNTTCLHPSDIRPKPEPIRIVRLPSGNPCSDQSIFSGPPASHCNYAPLPPERKTAAATNWSYNYNIRNNSPATKLYNESLGRNTQNSD